MIKSTILAFLLVLSFTLAAKDINFISAPKEIAKNIYLENKLNSSVLVNNKDVIKKNGAIELNFKNRSSWIIADNIGIPNGDYKQTYDYAGSIPDLNVFVIKVNSYENTSYLLINKDTGALNILEEAPILSEDKKIALSLFINIYDQHDISPPTLDVKLFDVQDQNFELIDSEVFPWKDNYEIIESYWKNGLIYLKTHNEHDDTTVYETIEISKKY
ncbi:hypothetical protein RHO12_11550 [Orbus sturtevantii]|uniref:hypothetical protein n=1 Tax=Orbus sturtevantii TaxID=3074109 RepID=UPI00370D7982